MRIFVTEFADSKREIERHLNDVTEPIIRHLFKLYCMPNHESRNHWIVEIANFLSSIKKLSGKNKFPNKHQILDWTYYKWEDLLTDKDFMQAELNTIEFKYHIVIKKPIEEVCETFNALCYDYFVWLSTELSKCGNIGHGFIYNKLNELF
jgi:hypothetical protein